MTALLELPFPRTKALFACGRTWTFAELEHVVAKGLGSKWHHFNPHGCCGSDRNQPGTYVFIQEGRVLYVGMTANLGNRFERHEVLVKIPGYVTVKVRHGDSRTGDFIAREYRLIRRFHPPLNTNYRMKDGALPAQGRRKREKGDEE